MKLISKAITKIRNMFSTVEHQYHDMITKDEYITINPEEIAELDKPPFPYKGLEESDYIDFLSKTEFLVDYYKNNQDLPPAENDEMQHLINSFYSSFLNVRFHINVNRMIDGSYKVASNGRHRMYIARKHGYKLLVHLGGEEISKKR